jgi:hypothetical protein
MYGGLVEELCVKAVSATLPSNLAHQMVADYYRACIELSPVHFTMHHFQQWLLSLLKLPLPGKTWTQSQTTAISQSSLFVGVPALGLFADSHKAMAWTASAAQPVTGTPSTLSLVSYGQKIFSALHVVYEELKLYVSEAGSLPFMASLLHHLASSLGGLASYCDHYHTDYPSLIPPSMGHTLSSAAGGGEERMECGERGEEVDTLPPSIMSHLHLMLKRGGEAPPYPLGNAQVCKRSAQVVKLYGLYSRPSESVSLSSLFTSSLPDSSQAEWQL